MSGHEVHFCLDVDPRWIAGRTLTDAQLQEVGILQQGDRARAMTAALLWVASLYGHTHGPMWAAWVAFCGAQTPMPFAVASHEVQLAPLRLVKRPTRIQKLTGAAPVVWAEYDGTAQASA